jgi:hypothetical protein
VNMTRALSIRKRVKRLEAVRRKQEKAVVREAYIKPSPFAGPTHLELNGPPVDGRFYFREVPGVGPTLKDFGEFTYIWSPTYDENNF